jgi:hypothetical protein
MKSLRPSRRLVLAPIAALAFLAVSQAAPAAAEPHEFECSTWHDLDSGYGTCDNPYSTTWQARLGVKCHDIGFHWEWTGWYDVPPTSTRSIGPRHCASGGVFGTTYQSRPKP